MNEIRWTNYEITNWIKQKREKAINLVECDFISKCFLNCAISESSKLNLIYTYTWIYIIIIYVYIQQFFFLNICIETIYSCKTMMMITSAKERKRDREKERKAGTTHKQLKKNYLVNNNET